MSRLIDNDKNEAKKTYVSALVCWFITKSPILGTVLPGCFGNSAGVGWGRCGESSNSALNWQRERYCSLCGIRFSRHRAQCLIARCLARNVTAFLKKHKLIWVMEGFMSDNSAIQLKMYLLMSIVTAFLYVFSMFSVKIMTSIHIITSIIAFFVFISKKWNQIKINFHSYNWSTDFDVCFVQFDRRCW